MAESVFGNWLWWTLVGFFLLWWWPKKIDAQTFQARATITVTTLATGQVDQSEQSTLPELELISSNWGYITSSQLEQIYVLNEAGEYREATGCHNKEAINQIQNLESASCLIEPHTRVAIPYAGAVYAKRGDTYIKIIPLAKVPEVEELLITEVMWMGSYNGTVSNANDEWIELFNNSSSTLNLEGVQIAGAGLQGEKLFIPADYLLPPFTFFIVGRYSVENSQLARTPDWVTSRLRISNSNCSIQLLSADEILLDELPSGKWQVGTNDTTNMIRASVQRTFFDLPGSDWSSWVDCSIQECIPGSDSQWKIQNPMRNFGTPWRASEF